MSVDARAAVVAVPGGPFEVTPVRVDAPRQDEVLVKVDAVGMCHADLAAQAGAFPFPLPGVLGHEGTGVVEAVGSAVTGLAEGDRVVLTFDSCGRCRPCLQGHPSKCDLFFALNFANGSRPDGTATVRRQGEELHGRFFGQSSFASYALGTGRNVIKVTADVEPHLLAPLGCGVQTGAGAVLNVLRPQPWHSLVVFGLGAVGLSAVMAAHLVGVEQVIAVDIAPARLELAARLGAAHVVEAGSEDVVAAVRELTGGGADVAIESSGVPAVLAQAIASGRSGSSIGVIGVPPFGVTAALDVAEIVNRSKRIQGIDEGDSNPAIFIPALAELVAAGRLPVAEIVHTYAFDDIAQAADELHAGQAIKPVLMV